MAVEQRMPTIYETPRSCPGCGNDFLPPRRADGRILEHCSNACRLTCARRSNAAGSPFEFGAGGRPSQTRERPARPATVLVRRPGSIRQSAPHPKPGRVKHPERVPAFGKRMAALRMARGWVQGDLAERIGASRNSVINWENGKAEPPVSKFAAIAEALDTTMDALWRGEAS